MTIPCSIDTGAVRREHREILAPRLDALRRVADSVGTAPVEVVRRGVGGNLRVLGARADPPR